MKIAVLVSLAVFYFTVGASAADFQTVNEESIRKFMEVMPEYKQFAEKFGEEAEINDGMTQALKYKEESDQFFAKYGITLAEFSLLSSRIALGYSAIEMKKQGISPQAMGMAKFYNLSESELSAVERNISGIQEALED